MLMTANGYAIKIGIGGNLDVYTISLVGSEKELFELGPMVETDLKILNLCDCFVLYDAETWVNEPITDPYLAINYM